MKDLNKFKKIFQSNLLIAKLKKPDSIVDYPFSAVNNVLPPNLFIFNTLGGCIVKRHCSQEPLKLQSYASRVASYVV